MRESVKKILLGLTAFSLFAAPAAHASEITDVDGNSLIGDENVHNLYAQEIDGNLARSVYDKFSLDNNEIANLHFNTEGGTVFADNLINFVNDKVDINGTINAIKNGAIDGNLYFLSPEGIAVGANGVINAGSFNGYSVNESDFEALRDGSMNDLKTQFGNIDGGNLNTSLKAVEINGVINSRNQITLRGKTINVNEGAALNADTNIDFTNLVNAGNTVENISNLNMKASADGSGDIIISAADSNNATVSLSGTINASGDVSIKAAANTTITETTDDNEIKSYAIISVEKNAVINAENVNINAVNNIDATTAAANFNNFDVRSIATIASISDSTINANTLNVEATTTGSITAVANADTNNSNSLQNTVRNYFTSVDWSQAQIGNYADFDANYFISGIDFTSAGAAAINQSNSFTRATVSNSTVNADNVKISAADNLYKESNSEGVAVNDSARSVTAIIENSTLDGNGTIEIDAIKNGADISTAPKISINKIANEVSATLVNSDALNHNNIKITAASDDVQTAGNNSSAATVSIIENILEAGIDGGEIKTDGLSIETMQSDVQTNVSGAADVNQNVPALGINQIATVNAVFIRDTAIKADNVAANSFGRASFDNSVSNDFGAAIAFNSINNAVETNVNNSTIDAETIDFTAKNNTNLSDVAVGKGMSRNGFAGNLALNIGNNSTATVVDGLTATNFKNLNITAEDAAKKIAVAGDIDAANNGTEFIEVARAHSASGDSDNKEKLVSQLLNSNIRAAENGKINLSTSDNSTVETTAAGAGVGGRYFINSQGGEATTFIEKDIAAIAENISISGAPDLNVKATSGGSVNTVGAVTAADGTQSAIETAVAIALNNINQDTNATLKNDKVNETAINLNNVELRAESTANITAGAGTLVEIFNQSNVIGAAGSGASNFIGSNTVATVDKVNVAAQKNFGVVARSDDILSNYAGASNFVSDGAANFAAGNSSAWTTIDRKTAATVNNATVNYTGTANVNANNSTQINNALYSLARTASTKNIPAAAIAVAEIGTNTVNNITGSKITGGTINVNTKNDVEIDVNETSSGAGALVNFNAVNNTTSANLKNATLEAGGAINIDTSETRNFNSTLIEEYGSGDVDVNIIATVVNGDRYDLYRNNSYGGYLLNHHFDTANKDVFNNAFYSSTYGLSDSQIKRLQQLIDDAQVSPNFSAQKGVSTAVTNSDLQAGGGITINSTEKNDANFNNGFDENLGTGAGVGDNFSAFVYKTATDVNNSNIAGGSVEIGANQNNSGINSVVYQGDSAVGGDVGIGYNSIEMKGTIAVNVNGSNISASDGDINLSAADIGGTSLKNFSYDESSTQLTSTVGKTVDNSSASVNLDRVVDGSGATKMNTFSANGNLVLEAIRDVNQTANVQTASSKVETATTTATAQDGGTASVIVNSSGHSFEATEIKFNALNTPTVSVIAPALNTDSLQSRKVTATAEATGGANISIDSANTFNAENIDFVATDGKVDNIDVAVQFSSINGFYDPYEFENRSNIATASTETNTSIKIGNQTFNGNPAVTVNATSNLQRDAVADGLTNGTSSSSGREKSATKSNDSVTVEIGTFNSNSAVKNTAINVVKSLDINAINNGVTNVKATGTNGGSEIIAISETSHASNNTISALVNGNWNIAGNFNLSAVNNDTVNPYVQQGNASVAGNGARVITYIDGTTTAAIGANSEITAKTVNVSSKSNVNVAPYNNEGLNILTAYFGDSNFRGSESVLEVNQQTYANIGAGATVTTLGTQNYSALSNDNLKNIVSVYDINTPSTLYCNAGTTVRNDNEISVGWGAALNSEGEYNFNFNANDTLALDSASTGSNSGSGLFINFANNYITRKNLIYSHGTINTKGAVNMNAGGVKENPYDEDASAIYVKAYIDSYNENMIPYNVYSKSNYSLSENNTINLDYGSEIVAGKTTSFRAESGEVDVVSSNKFWWRASDNNSNRIYRNNALNVIDGDKNNYVTVNGKINAGSGNSGVNIEIAGTIVPSDYNIKGTNSNGSITVTSSVPALEIDYTVGEMDYSSALARRLDELNALIRYYSTKNYDTAAVMGYIAERERIYNVMRDLGLSVVETAADGTVYESFIDEGVLINYVELGDLSAYSAGVAFKTDSIRGSGSIFAQASPSITITNRSNAYLRVNDITIGGNAGTVKLNGSSISTGWWGSSNPNVDKNLGIYGWSSDIGTVTIYNDPIAQDVEVTYKSDSSMTDTYTPRTDLRLMGTISNPEGNVSITNTAGDIDISGEQRTVVDENGVEQIIFNTAAINGKNISIESTGSLNQGYVAGMINIGGNPEDLLSNAANNLKNQLGSALSRTSNNTVKRTTNNFGAAGTNNGRISGNNIYIAALDININGIIQSGYSDYSATVSDSDIENLKTAIAKNDSSYLSTRKKDASGNYAINDGGATYDSRNGYYNYTVPIHYDADNNRLIAEDIDAAGGTIYLNGRIASTGNGAIIAADGAANINITNNSSLPIEFGKIINADREGKITIVDTAYDWWREYTPTQTSYIDDYSYKLKEHFFDNTLDDFKQTYQVDNSWTHYTPRGDLRYNWTNGTVSATSTYYHTVVETSGWFDDLKTKTTTEKVLEEYEGTAEATTIDYNNVNLPSGSFLSTGNYYYDYNLYVLNLTADNRLMNGGDPVIISETTQVYSDNIIYKKYTTTLDWKRDVGSLQAYTYDIYAAWPIDIRFIGQENGATTLRSNSSIYLGGDVTMNNFDAELNITSNNGGIHQTDGAITTDKVYFRAANDIDGINITSIGRERTYYFEWQDISKYYDTVNLDVKSSGDIEIAVVGGVLDGNVMPGDVYLEKMEGGNIKLSATGNITGDNGVTGKTIALSSENGNIGTENSSVYVSASLGVNASMAVEAKAKGDICLSGPQNGALKIGHIESTDGVVYLYSRGYNGEVIQVGDYQSGVEDVDEETKIHAWIDAGLIAPTSDYEGAYIGGLKQAVVDYETAINDEYSAYESGKAAFESAAATAETEYGEYLTVKNTYEDFVEEVGDEYEEYIAETEDIQSTIEYEYNRLQTLAAMSRRSSSQEKTYQKLLAKYNDYDSASDYYIANAADLIDDEELIKFIGYDSLDDYLTSTYEGKLMAKYSNYSSAAAYIESLAGYKLNQKYGRFADVAAYLATDSEYRALVSALNNVKFPSTLSEMLAADEAERLAAQYDVTSKSFYIDNYRIK